MVQRKKTKTSDVSKFLIATGFVFEMEIAELLKTKGYKVEMGQTFLDLEEGKRREIDIIASKEINKITVNLIIECKQSIEGDWIFVCLNKNPSRYYFAVKHFPVVTNLRKNKLLNCLHNFDRKIQIAQNYLTFLKKSGKKGENLQIKECLHKLPKALLYFASRRNEKVKNIFFPVGLFSKQMFSISYDKELLVKEIDLIQYYINFDCMDYRYKRKFEGDEELFSMSAYEKNLRDEETERIISTSRNSSSHFQIDFVTKKGLNNYLKMIEETVGKISARKWTYNVRGSSV